MTTKNNDTIISICIAAGITYILDTQLVTPILESLGFNRNWIMVSVAFLILFATVISLFQTYRNHTSS